MEIFSLFGSIFVDNDEANKSISKTEKKAEGLASKLGSGIKTAAKFGAGIATGVGVAAAGIMGLAKKTADTTDNIDKMSQKLGLTTEGYQEWDYILSQSGTSIDAMSNGMKTLTNMTDDLSKGSKSATDAFGALGMSAEDLEGKSQEEIFEMTVTALQGMEDGTKRAAIANDLLGRSGQELAPLLNAGAGAVESLKTQAHDMGLVLDNEAVKGGANFTDALDKLQRTMGSLMTKAIAPLMPTITSLIGSFTEIIPVLMEFIAPLMEKLTPVLQNIIEKLLPVFINLFNSLLPILEPIISIFFIFIDNVLIPFIEFLTPIIDTLLPIFLDIFNMLNEPITKVLNVLGEIAKSIMPVFLEILNMILPVLTNFLSQGLDQFVKILDMLTPLILEIIESLLPVFMELLNMLLPVIINLVDMGLNSFFEIIEMLLPPIIQLAQIILPILVDVLNMLLPILEPILSLFNTLTESVLPIVTTLFKVLSEKILPIFNDVFGKAISSVVDIGKNIVEGLWKGISNAADWLKSKIKGFADGVVGGIKGFFGIKSPSKVMAEEVGKFIPEGVAVGIETNADSIQKALGGINTKLQFAGAGAGGTGNTNNITMNVTYNVPDKNTAEYANDNLLKKLQGRGLAGGFR